MHEEFIGAGVANLFIERMKLEGWLPIKEYFKMKKHKDSGRKSGWYKDEIDNPNRRIDDWTNVIMFKLIDKPYVDGIRDSILDKYKEAEGITDTHAYNLSFNEAVIKQCKGIK